MIAESLAHVKNVRIVSISTLLVNVAKDVNATRHREGPARRLDFESEMQMAQMNRSLSGVETVPPFEFHVLLYRLATTARGRALRRRRLALRARRGRQTPDRQVSRRWAMTSFDGYDDPEEFQEPSGRHVRRDIETDLRDLIELVANAKQMPLSNSALIPRDDVLGLLEQALRSLPTRSARRAGRCATAGMMAAELQKAQQLMDQVRAERHRMVDKPRSSPEAA